MEMVAKIDAFGSDKSTIQKNSELAEDASVTRVFGIDLGTTNSAISIVKEGVTPIAIALTNGRYTMPSCVMWKDGKFIVGDEAYVNRAQPNVIYSVKRMMQTPGAVVNLVDGPASITCTPTQISAEILKGLIAQTDGMYGEIKDVVVTVPAYFTQIGKDNTRKACELAGLNLIALENEPSAAALQYDLSPDADSSEDILIYDLGGGTFDVTLVRVTDNKGMSEMAAMFGMDCEGDDSGRTIEALSINGDPRLGGDDIDYEMFKIVCNKIGIPSESVSMPYRKQCILRLEQMKKSGVTNRQYHFNFNTVLVTGQEINTVAQIDENDFAKALEPSYQKTKKITEDILRSVPSSVKKMILVGGSTKIELLVRMLKRDFPDFEINNAFDPDLSVTRGAAIKGKILKYGDSNIHVFDILPISIGALEDEFVSPLIAKNTVLPTVKTLAFTTTRDNQTSVALKLYQGDSRYPEECVSLGELEITGIKEQPAGVPMLVVNISVSADSLMTCTADIEGFRKEIKLNLSGDAENIQHELSRDEKQILRWRSRARALGGKLEVELNSMLDQYPEHVTREQIVAFIREHCKMQDTKNM